MDLGDSAWGFNESHAVDNSTTLGLYEVPGTIVIILSVFYGTISAVAVTGNSLVLWVVVTSKRLQSVTNYYIANLALADIIIGLFSIPFQFQAALLQRWHLPDFMCAFCPFFQCISVNVSIFTLTAIAVDRYFAIMHPLTHHPTKIQAKVLIFFLWAFSVLLAVPQAVALRVHDVVDLRTGTSKPFCDDIGISRDKMRVYKHILVSLQYFLPLFVISYAYILMGTRLWGSEIPGNAEGIRDALVMRNKKKVIKMLVMVVVLFAICWLPLQLYHILEDFYPSINNYRYINIIWFCSHWLAMSNSCYNPFIYAIYNEKFKREFRIKFRKWPCCRRMRQTEFSDMISELDKNRFNSSIRYKGHYLEPSTFGQKRPSPKADTVELYQYKDHKKYKLCLTFDTKLSEASQMEKCERKMRLIRQNSI